MQALAKRTVEEFGRIDILINNAGILRDKSFAKMEMADFRAVVDVHLIGSANASRAVWDIMKGQNFGRILMTTSTSGVYGNFGQSNYGAAKAGLVGLMNVLHFEGDRYDIHVNAIAPTAATRMTGDVLDEEMLVRLAPENVVPAALFLVSDQAPSRTMLLAGAGTVARMAIVESEGVYLPKSERTPEAVAAAFKRSATYPTLSRPMPVWRMLIALSRPPAHMRSSNDGLKTRPKAEPRSAYREFYQMQTRWSDMDIYGHVNNVVYMQYCDAALNRSLIAAGALICLAPRPLVSLRAIRRIISPRFPTRTMSLLGFVSSISAIPVCCGDLAFSRMAKSWPQLKANMCMSMSTETRDARLR